MFLNLLDGIDASVTGGLLLIATTNHPEQLDPAINNRPGRFDVVIEVALARPRAAAGVPAQSPAGDRGGDDGKGRGADRRPVVRASAGDPAPLRPERDPRRPRAAHGDEDLIGATATVREAYDDAVRGFPPKPELPFGLLHLRKRKQESQRT